MEGKMDHEKYEYAGFWIRVAASLIDKFLIAMITMPLTIMIYGDLVWKNESIILGPADFLINHVLPSIAIMLFWLYKSATPGKMALNIKIVDADTGGKLSVGQIMGRYFAYILASLVFSIGIIWPSNLSLAVSLLASLVFIWVAFDKRKQGWHDKLAKTVVIRKKTIKVEFKN